MKLLRTITELVFVVTVSFFVLLWIGSIYVIAGVITAVICSLLMLSKPRPGQDPWFEHVFTLLLGVGLGVFWPSLPFVIFVSDARRRNRAASDEGSPRDS